MNSYLQHLTGINENYSELRDDIFDLYDNAPVRPGELKKLEPKAQQLIKEINDKMEYLGASQTFTKAIDRYKTRDPNKTISGTEIQEHRKFVSNEIQEHWKSIMPDTDRYKYYINNESSTGTEKLYPVYITLFSNKTPFGKLIKGATGSQYTHSTVSLDSTMNNMYSFSHIPFSWCADLGFVRESIWSPEYRQCEFFTVCVTFVDKKGRDAIQKKIDNFIKDYDKYNYNTVGLIEYYFKFKNTKNKDERKKMKWFCSEFVSAAVDSGGVEGFENILAAPNELKDRPNVFVCGDWTIDNFNEKELIKAVNKAEKEYRKNKKLSKLSITESQDGELIDFNELNAIILHESSVRNYVALVDWKKLYDTFIDLFPKNDPKKRFDLFEIIVRQSAALNKKVTDMTNNITIEMRKIATAIDKGILTVIDIAKNVICFKTKDNKDKAITYPTLSLFESALSLKEKRELAKQRNVPIFICLFHFSSVLSTVIAAVTKDAYTHSAISFDTSLTDMYSFGKFYPNNPVIGKFVHESLFGPTYNQVTRHAIYAVFVTPEEKKLIKEKLDWFIANKGKMRYNYEGLVKSLFKIPDPDGQIKYAYLCSEFVASILKSSGRDFVDTPANLVKPNDFDGYSWCYYLGSGKERAYDQASVDRRLKEIIEQRNAGNELYLETAEEICIDKYHTIKESNLALNPDRAFNRVQKIVSTMDKTDISHFTNGTFKDSPNIIYRNIMSNNNGSGFIDVYKFNNRETSGFIVVAVEKSARGQGLAEKLVNDAIANCPPNTKTFIWRCDKDNPASAKLAEKCGFTKTRETKNQISYRYDRSSAIVTEDIEELNEYIQTNQISSREERDRLMSRYGLRKGGYGQRTKEEDERRATKSLTDELRVSNKERKKIYREDADADIDNPDAYGYEFEWCSNDKQNAPFNGLHIDKSLDNQTDINEASDKILVDPNNEKMVANAKKQGYEFVEGQKLQGVAQPMYKFDRNIFGVKGKAVNIGIFRHGKDKSYAIGFVVSPNELYVMINDMYDNQSNLKKFTMSEMKTLGFTTVILYTTDLTDTQLLRLEKKLNWFVGENSSFAYLLNNIYYNYEQLCTKFILFMMNCGTDDNPYDNNDFVIEYVGSYNLADYDQTAVDTVVEALMKRRVTINIANEAVLPFIKSFNIRIDKDGNIQINQKEYNDFDRHAQNSLRLLKIYKEANNLESMKSELCRLYYMVELIDKYYSKGTEKNADYHKKMINLRSVMLNALTNYLKYVAKNDATFNFTEYYDSSKYGQNIKITPKGIAVLGKVVQTLL